MICLNLGHKALNNVAPMGLLGGVWSIRGCHNVAPMGLLGGVWSIRGYHNVAPMGLLVISIESLSV